MLAAPPGDLGGGSGVGKRTSHQPRREAKGRPVEPGEEAVPAGRARCSPPALRTLLSGARPRLRQEANSLPTGFTDNCLVQPGLGRGL